MQEEGGGGVGGGGVFIWMILSQPSLKTKALDRTEWKTEEGGDENKAPMCSTA